MTLPHGRPDALELIEAVKQFLDEEVMGALEGQLAFHVRVASNALAISMRELSARAADSRAHAQRLSRLGSADDAVLAAAIRDGSLDDCYGEVAMELRDMVEAKIAVVNPRYVEDDGK